MHRFSAGPSAETEPCSISLPSSLAVAVSSISSGARSDFIFSGIFIFNSSFLLPAAVALWVPPVARPLRARFDDTGTFVKASQNLVDKLVKLDGDPRLDQYGKGVRF